LRLRTVWTDVRFKAAALTVVIIVLFLTAAVPHVEGGTLYIDWQLDTTENGEFITAYAHLYGVPQIEKTYGLYFCVVTVDASKARVPADGIIEVSVGDYAQPARYVYEITKQDVYKYGLNPTFNAKVAEISTPTPVTASLKITLKTGEQIYADSKTIQMLPIGYYVWVLGENDRRFSSPVLATPHADAVQKVISAAARATPWNSILGYQEAEGYSHLEILDYQMRAVYNVLQNLGVTYVSTSTTFTSTDAQRVRLPVQTLSDNSGNCIETTLLFDAIFEAIGFHTYFVFITGHVYLAVQEWPDSDRVVPLETTMLGFGTYDQARSTGLDEYGKAPDDQQYLQVDVQKVRNAGIEPTPYMDKMPEGARFYQKIDQVSTEIVSSRQMIEKCSGAMKEVASLPPAAEKNLQDAQVLFNDGKYADAEKLAADTMASLTTTSTASTGSDVVTEVLAYAFLLMPVVVIVLVVLYVRARRRRTVAPQAAAATMPAASPVRYCVQCGKEIPLNKNFCKYCGATQQP
jgi:hypothetical protein